MAFKKKRKKIFLGTISVMMIIMIVTILSSAILSKVGFQAEKTALVNGSLIVSFTSVKNFLSIDGLKYLFENIILNFQMFKPLLILVVSLVTFGIFESSGLLQFTFNPWRKLTSKTVTFLIVLLSFISSIFGEYSFAIMLPFVGALYNYLGRNPLLGILTSFLGITLGYGSGLLINNEQLLLGGLTQLAATMDVDKNYLFNGFASSIIMTVSMVIFVPVLTLLIENQLAVYFEKPIFVNNEKNESKKAFVFSIISFVILLLLFVYMIIPGLPKSGVLLDMTQTAYYDMLFSTTAPFSSGLPLILLILISIPSYIYGKISGNLETSLGITDSLAVGLKDCGYLFLIAFFGSIMIGIFEWTGIGEVIVCKIIEILSKFSISGVLLIGIFFILVILMTVLVPSTLTKWSLMSPVVVPLFMRANITPDFTQFIFQVSDGIGKSLSIFFPYFLLMLGLLHKYNFDDIKVSAGIVIKRVMPIILIMAALWILFLVMWYLAGFPVGISEYATL